MFPFAARRGPSGTIRMRLAPGGVAVFTATASKNGAIKEQITHAEDLAQQVTDTERELALLTTHRDRLTDIQKDKNLKIDQLITVSRELATVQSQIEAAATTGANLHRRIDTDFDAQPERPGRDARRATHPRP